MGRQARSVDALGTITRTVFDGLGRPSSTWIGTDDTPTSGDWSPTNTTGTDLTKVSENEYDNSGLGDSMLTKIVQYPGTGSPRVRQMWYDWRDRLVATKGGVQETEDTSTHRPILFSNLDNLGRATTQSLYDGDQVYSLTITDGVPAAPDGSKLRARSKSYFDEEGKVYQTEVYSVVQSGGSAGTVSTTALTTNMWYSGRGMVLKTTRPGGPASKTVFDGAGRPTVSYVSDDAGNGVDVSGDHVLSQTSYTLDANGNTTLTTSKQRLNDTTATGALGDAGIAPQARVSYAGVWYDLADRTTDTADYGVLSSAPTMGEFGPGAFRHRAGDQHALQPRGVRRVCH